MFGVLLGSHKTNTHEMEVIGPLRVDEALQELERIRAPGTSLGENYLGKHLFWI